MSGVAESFQDFGADFLWKVCLKRLDKEGYNSLSDYDSFSDLFFI